MRAKPIPLILIHCDNQIALAKVGRENHNSKSSKHIKLIYTILRKLNTTRVIRLNFIKLVDSLAGCFTKMLSKGQTRKMTKEIGLKSNHEYVGYKRFLSHLSPYI